MERKIKEGLNEVVQLYIDEKPRLAINDISTYHKFILERILNEDKLKFESVNLGYDWNGPALKGERYRVVGMGLVLRSGNSLFFSGGSEDYKIGINQEHLKECKELLGDNFSIFISSDNYLVPL